MTKDLTYRDNPQLYEEVEDIPGEKAMFSRAAEIITGYAKKHPHGISVLDLCCGTGPIIEYLPADSPRPLFKSITGVDISKKYLDFASNKYFYLPTFGYMHGLELNFVQADAVEYTHPERVDLVLASSAYHHIEDERKVSFLNKIHEQLKDNGIVVFCENLIGDYNNLEARAKSVTNFYMKRIEEMKEMRITDRRLDLVKRVLQYELDREYEWKHPYRIFMENLRETGFEIVSEEKVWPSVKMFDDEKVGDFVIVAKKK